MKKEYDFSKLKEVKDPYASKKKAVGINLMIDLYLLDCAKRRRKLSLKWAA